MELLGKLSPKAKVFILIHKMDKVKEYERDAIFEKKKKELYAMTPQDQIKHVFATSIWDETLYKVDLI